MVKRIIITILVLGVVIGVGNMIGDSYRLIAHDRLAVSQLEDSDENVIALNASTRMIKYMRIIQLVIIILTLWFIWGKYLKEKYKEIIVEESEIGESSDDE